MGGFMLLVIIMCCMLYTFSNSEFHRDISYYFSKYLNLILNHQSTCVDIFFKMSCFASFFRVLIIYTSFTQGYNSSWWNSKRTFSIGVEQFVTWKITSRCASNHWMKIPTPPCLMMPSDDLTRSAAATGLNSQHHNGVGYSEELFFPLVPGLHDGEGSNSDGAAAEVAVESVHHAMEQ